MSQENVTFVTRGGQSRTPSRNVLTKLFVTVNKHDLESDEDFTNKFKQFFTSYKCYRCSNVTYQFERGQESGRLHVHAALKMRRSNRVRILQMVRACRESDTWPEGSPVREVKVERIRDWPAAVAYCSKDDTRVAGPFGDLPEPTRESFDLTAADLPALYPWQQCVVNTVTAPDVLLPEQWRSRTVFWLWENDGGVGKTMLLRYLVVNHRAVLLQGAARHCKAVAYKHPADIYVFSVPRSAKDPDLSVIEDIKDGIYMSGFGVEGTGMVCRKCPQIIVLANRRCSNMAGLTRDRWCEVEINLGFRVECADGGKTRIDITADNQIINYDDFNI